MGLSQRLQAGRLVLLATSLLLIGCASVNYRPDAMVTQSRFTTIENYSTDAIGPEQVDGLLQEVAEILHVTLDPSKPKARILVITPGRIAETYRALTAVAAYGADAEALYFPGVSLVMISYFDRTILGHELAHYLTDHYLKHTPRGDWEKIAHSVERKLPATAKLPVAPTRMAAHGEAPVQATTLK